MRNCNGRNIVPQQTKRLLRLYLVEDEGEITLRHRNQRRPDVAVEIVVLKGFTGVVQAIDNCALDLPHAVSKRRQILGVVVVLVRDQHGLDPLLLFQRESRGQTARVNRQPAVHQQRHKANIAAGPLVRPQQPYLHTTPLYVHIASKTHPSARTIIRSAAENVTLFDFCGFTTTPYDFSGSPAWACNLYPKATCPRLRAAS